jgi:hypothetical protein
VSLSQELRTAVRAVGVLLAGLVACLAVYFLFGHWVLTAVHGGTALPVLDRLLGARSQPLGHYLATADARVVQDATTAFVSFFLYLFIVFVVRRLLKRDTEFVRAAPAQPDRTRVSETALAFLIYALLTVAFFYRVVPHINSQLIGPPEDNMQHVWDLWFARNAAGGTSGFLHTTRIFYPEGTSLLFHPFSWFNLLLASTIGFLLTPVAAYNLLILLTFVLSGVGAFLLIRHLTRDTAAALLGGFVFAFNPSHFAHALHQIEIASIQFIPFFVLFYLKVLERKSASNVAWASTFFLLNSLCSWYYMLLALLCMAVCYGVEAHRSKRLLLPGAITSSIIVLGATLVVLSPLVVSMLVTAATHSNLWPGGYGRYVVDMAGLLVPHYNHIFARVPLVARVNASYTGFAWESVGYLGLVGTGLMLASSRVLVKRAAPYLLGLVCFLPLAFGPRLHFLGRAIPSVLPYALIRHIPILSGARAPGRMMAYAYIFLAVLVAVAFSYQLREGFLRNRRWVAFLVVLGICADFWSPCREMTPVRLPPAYAAILGSEPAVDFGLLDLPGESSIFCARYMMYQTLHGIPIVQGYLPRKPSRSLVDSLAYDNLSAQREQLRSARVKYIVIHKQLLKQKTDAGEATSPERYVEEYGRFYEDSENLVLRVY